MRKELYYVQLLNEACPVNDGWYYEDNSYKIKTSYMNQELLDWIESIVGCSYFYEKTDNRDLVIYGVTGSTLESKIKMGEV